MKRSAFLLMVILSASANAEYVNNSTKNDATKVKINQKDLSNQQKNDNALLLKKNNQYNRHTGEKGSKFKEFSSNPYDNKKSKINPAYDYRRTPK